MICLDQVEKFQLKGIQLHIPKGVSVGLVGAQGCGKTTLIKLMCGLLKPVAGRVYVMGENPIENRSPRMGVFLKEQMALSQDMTVKEHFEQLKIVYGMDLETFKRSYSSLLKRFELVHEEQTLIRHLSKGKKRRVELMTTLIHDPEVVLLDDPMDHLDAFSKEVLMNLLNERQRLGLTVIMTSHKLEDVSEFCKRVILLCDGRIHYDGDMVLLLKQYAPIEKMTLKLEDIIPDLGDLPIKRYTLNGQLLTIYYNSNHVTSLELVRNLVTQCTFLDMNVQRSELADVIYYLKGDEKNA